MGHNLRNFAILGRKFRAKMFHFDTHYIAFLVDTGTMRGGEVGPRFNENDNSYAI